MISFLLCVVVAGVVSEPSCDAEDRCSEHGVCHESAAEPLHASSMLQVRSRADLADGTKKHIRAPDRFRKKYGRFGRQPPHVKYSPGDILIDYEVQWGSLRLNPDIVLDTWYTHSCNPR